MTVAAIQGLLRAEYMLGNLRAVDELLPVLERAAEAALLPFGAVRVSLCRTTNAIARGELDGVQQLIDATMREGNRYRTFNAEIAATVQQLLLLFERDELGLLADLVRLRAKERGPGVWHAVLALCEPDRRRGAADRARAAGAGRRLVLAVRRACRRGRCTARRCGDRARGAHPRLDELGDRTITVGLGTAVMGFATHFAGLAHVATGSLDTARDRFERAIELAAGNGAALWEAHSTVELADVLCPIGRPASAHGEPSDARRAPRLARRVRLEPSRPPRDRGRPRRRRTLTTSARIGFTAGRGKMEHWPRWFHPPVIGRGARGPSALLVVAMVAAGCSGPPKEEVLIEITPKVAGMLTVATTLPAPGFWEGDDVSIVGGGYEWGLARSLADEFDLDLKVIDVPFADIVEGRLEGADMALAQIEFTEERSEVLDFSLPYYASDFGVLMLAGERLRDLDHGAGPAVDRDRWRSPAGLPRPRRSARPSRFTS